MFRDASMVMVEFLVTDAPITELVRAQASTIEQPKGTDPTRSPVTPCSTTRTMASISWVSGSRPGTRTASEAFLRNLRDFKAQHLSELTQAELPELDKPIADERKRQLRQFFAMQ